MVVALFLVMSGETSKIIQNFLLVLSSLLAVSQTAHADTLASQSEVSANQVQPQWSLHTSGENIPNISYLSNTTTNYFHDTNLRDQLFDPKLTMDMKQQYEDMNRNYDIRKTAALVGRDEEAAHDAQMTDFTRSTLKNFGNHHIQENISKAEKAGEKIVDNDSTLKQLKKPVAVAAVVAGVYTGKTMKVKVAQDTKLSTRTDIQGQNGTVGLEAPWLVNGAVDFNARPGQNDKVPDESMHNDRYRLALSRGLPIWGLSSGLSYATTTTTTTASLSKVILPNTTCVVDSARRMNNDSYGQERVSVLYGIHF